jgi:nitrite reductase/ring-hydroxylating ferredoxin subunit
MVAREDRWVPIALEGLVHHRSCHPVVVDDYELVLWRGETSPVQVWEDRCPHRGMRLSFGFVEGDRLACLYHGWTYAVDGRCISIPAHPDLAPPKTICSRTYAARIWRGIVFANLASEPDAIWPGPVDKAWSAIRSLYLAAPAATVMTYFTAPENALGVAGRPAELGTLELETAEGPVVIGIQSVSAVKAAVHISSETADTDMRLGLSRKLLQARRDIESRTVETDNADD